MAEEPNPIVQVTNLRAYPGWVIREYANGTFDAINTKGTGLSPVERSFADALYFVQHGEPVIR